MKNIRNDFFDELENSLLSGNGRNLRVMENMVSIEKQFEFIQISASLKKYKLPSISEQIELLNTPELSEAEKKIIFTSLAVSGDVKAFRALEQYRQDNPGEWIDVALMHATMMLESKFTDEKRVFISTGLGGKNGKFRYAALFKSTGLKEFSDYQRNLIEKEIPFYVNRHGGEIEELSLGNNYFTLVFLQDIDSDVRTLLDNAIAECNQYGDFIQDDSIVTNIKRFSDEEIQSALTKKR
jgi:hypothetical protein